MKRKTVSIPEAAEWIGCCRQQVYKLRDAGKIEAYKHGTVKGYRIFLDSIHSFIKSRTGE
jgi:excisionase family DNA binding protein